MLNNKLLGKADAERGFFRAIKALRQFEREAEAESEGPRAGSAREALGSFLPAESIASILKDLPAEPRRIAASSPSNPLAPPRKLADGGTSFVPIAIGRVG